ncbi:MAG: rod shape-determining protein MreC [Clostridia bacterium]|nr:rod shape-determining protein MreC [Clostridia bacterium]
MARIKLPGRKKDDDRPLVKDDFIYNEPDEAPSPNVSDTPDEALRKLRGRGLEEEPLSGKRMGRKAAAVSGAEASGKEDSPSEEQESAEERDFRDRLWDETPQDEDSLQPIRARRRANRGHPTLRLIAMILITVVLVLFSAAYIFHRIIPTAPILGDAEVLVGEAVTPVQSFFSSLTEEIAGYFRSIKLRQNIENEYNALRAENEQLVYKAMLADELQQTLSQYEDLSDEIAANANMQPIVCTVIGKSDSNYFSTFTINKGSNDGLENYMAVTISGALVGYTEMVQPSVSTVRTIIDSEASIAALISSSRDQGTVRGTLGVDGTALCRMYYLPDDNLPRPGDTVVTSGVGMSFPKGIPIGTVRESTRGMESNKQYIVVEPLADFQHLEYVIVLRYKPVAEAIQGRENGRASVELVPLESARPSPVVPQIASSLFESQTTPDPNATATPTPEPTETPSPTPEPTQVPTPTPEYHNYEYVPVLINSEPTPTMTPTPVPTPTPYLTPDPDAMTYEEDME